jgi:hypothetical protein
MPISRTSNDTATIGATQTLERWSAEWLRAYFGQPGLDLAAAGHTLVTELRALAEDDIQEAARRGIMLLEVLTETLDISEGGMPRLWLTQTQILVSSFSMVLEGRDRPRLIDGVPNRIYMQERLAEIDRRAALQATDGSASTAFELFLRHGLITREEYDAAKARSGNLWNYAGD